MKFEEFIKKLGLALEDEDTATALEAFGIKPDQLEGFKDLTIPTNLDEALKIKGVQSEVDKRLGKAAQTREENLKKKFNFVEKEEQEEEEEEINTNDPAMKAMLKELKEMREWREKQEKAKEQETLEQKKTRAKEYLKSKNIPGVYVHEMDLEKDFEEQFETLSEKVKEDGISLEKPEPTNPRQTRIPVPTNGGAKKPSKEEISKIVG